MKDIEENRTRIRKGRLIYTSALIVAMILASVVISIYLLSPHNGQSPNQTTASTSSDKAAIVDQLSLSIPNQTFIQTVTAMLEQAGFLVEYYGYENVTVEFIRNLPEYGHRIIILRAHSTPTSLLFTNEPYSSDVYIYEQLTDQIRRGRILGPSATDYFIIGSNFIRMSMRGRFPNSLIISMGCSSLLDTRDGRALALLEKGASAYLGWNGPVTSSQADRITARFLQSVIIEKLSIRQALNQTLKEAGGNLAYGSLLIFSPLEAEGYSLNGDG